MASSADSDFDAAYPASDTCRGRPETRRTGAVRRSICSCEPGPARSLRSLRPVRRGGRHSKRCQTVDAGQATPAALAAARTGPAASRADRPEGQASPAAGPKAVKLT